MKVGFGIVGLGVIADFHAQAIQATDKSRLIACCSRSQDKADAFGGKYGCKGYSSFPDFLSHPELDVVSICTPSGAHLEYALEAIDAGKHLVIEKPLEVTLKRCDKIINACKKKGLLCAGVFQSRFNEVSGVIKHAIDSGRLGRIIMADSYTKWFRNQEYYTKNGSWHGSWEHEGGGALMTQAIHSIDLLQWLMGPVDSVQAFMGALGHTGIEVEDTAAATLQFKNGALGVIEGSTAIYPGYDRRLEIYGKEGSIILVRDYLEAWDFAEEIKDDKKIRRKFSDVVNKKGGAASDPTDINFEGHKRQFENLIDSLESGKSLLVDGIEARKAVEIILAIYKSAKKGKLVRL